MELILAPNSRPVIRSVSVFCNGDNSVNLGYKTVSKNKNTYFQYRHFYLALRICKWNIIYYIFDAVWERSLSSANTECECTEVWRPSGFTSYRKIVWLWQEFKFSSNLAVSSVIRPKTFRLGILHSISRVLKLWKWRRIILCASARVGCVVGLVWLWWDGGGVVVGWWGGGGFVVGEMVLKCYVERWSWSC